MNTTIPHKRHCSFCKNEGHNKSTCPARFQHEKPAREAAAAAEREIQKKVAERLEEEKKKVTEKEYQAQLEAGIAATIAVREREKAKAEKAYQDQLDANIAANKAERAAAEKAYQDKLNAAIAASAAERARVEAELEADYQRSIAEPRRAFKDPVLHLLFHLIYDPNATMEYMNLRDHYAKNPEMFKMVGTEHSSNDDRSPHHTFEVRKTFIFTAPSGKLVTRNWVNYYHIYYTIQANRKIWTDLTSRDRQGIPYTLAKFNHIPK